MDFRRHHGGVDGVAGRLPVQHVQHLLGGFNGDFPLGFLRGGAQVGRGQQAGVVEDGQVAGGFVDEHIQGGAGQLLPFQRFQQGLIVNQLAPGHIDEARAGLHQRQAGAGNQVHRAGRQRRVQGHEIGLGQQFLQGHHRHAQAGREVGGHEGVVGDEAHTEGGGAARHFGTHAAQAHDAQGFVAHLNAHKGGALPLAGFHAGASLRDIARQRQHQRHGMLGGGHGVAHGGVDHGHAGPGGGVQVNVVHADAGARHYLEVAPGGDDGLGDPGFAADDQGVIIADGGDQFVRG